MLSKLLYLVINSITIIFYYLIQGCSLLLLNFITLLGLWSPTFVRKMKALSNRILDFFNERVG